MNLACLFSIYGFQGDTVLHVARQSSSRGVAVLVLEKCSELESVKNKVRTVNYAASSIRS